MCTVPGFRRSTQRLDRRGSKAWKPACIRWCRTGALLGVLVVATAHRSVRVERGGGHGHDPAEPAHPVVGESVTFTAPASSDRPKTYTFTVDGTPPPSQTTNSITRSFSRAGNAPTRPRSTSRRSEECCQEIYRGRTRSQSPPTSARLDCCLAGPARASGQPAGDADGDAVRRVGELHLRLGPQRRRHLPGGPGDSITDRQPTTTFTTTGPHVVKVKIDDDSGHEVIVQRTPERPAPDNEHAAAASSSVRLEA